MVNYAILIGHTVLINHIHNTEKCKIKKSKGIITDSMI